MGTVSTSALLGGLVDLDVLDDEVGGVETLGVSVGLGVLEETEQKLGGLGGPASAGDTELLACRGEIPLVNIRQCVRRSCLLFSPRHCHCIVAKRTCSEL